MGSFPPRRWGKSFKVQKDRTTGNKIIAIAKFVHLFVHFESETYGQMVRRTEWQEGTLDIFQSGFWAQRLVIRMAI